MLCFFFFKQKTAYEMRISDWSSDVCSSDLDRSRSRSPPDSSSRRGGRRPLPSALEVRPARRSGHPSGRKPETASPATALPPASSPPPPRPADAGAPTRRPPHPLRPSVPSSDIRPFGAGRIIAYLAGRDRKSVVEGKSVYVRVELGGGRILTKKKKTNTHYTNSPI